MRFTKAHGIGNDFIIVAEADVPPDMASWAVRLCDRNKGIGGDGVLVVGIDPAEGSARMKLLNPDGTHGEISGNGVRCVGAFAFSRRLLGAVHTVVPAPGPRPVEVKQIGPSLFSVDTNLGRPGLGSASVPVTLGPMDRVVACDLDVGGEVVQVTNLENGRVKSSK